MLYLIIGVALGTVLGMGLMLLLALQVAKGVRLPW